MTWELTWGHEYETLREIQRETGITPRALLDRPPLLVSERHYLEAFYELSRGRSIGEVPQPISVSDFLAYCQLMGVDSLAEREHLYKIVSKLDGAFLTHMAKKREATLEAAKK